MSGNSDTAHTHYSIPNTESMDEIDITIIGAGVVGLAVAAELARQGRDVLVLERFVLLKEEQPGGQKHEIDAYLAQFELD